MLVWPKQSFNRDVIRSLQELEFTEHLNLQNRAHFVAFPKSPLEANISLGTPLIKLSLASGMKINVSGYE